MDEAFADLSAAITMPLSHAIGALEGRDSLTWAELQAPRSMEPPIIERIRDVTRLRGRVVAAARAVRDEVPDVAHYLDAAAGLLDIAGAMVAVDGDPTETVDAALLREVLTDASINLLAAQRAIRSRQGD